MQRQERVNYPTQKPISLLERIIKIASNEGDLVLDPFCGSGTTLLAAKFNNRYFMGIDISRDAVQISKDRLKNPIKSQSVVLDKGREFFLNQQINLRKYIFDIDFVPVQRHNGIDAILKEFYKNAPILIRIQRDNESLNEAYKKLQQAVENKKSQKSFLIQTHNRLNSFVKFHFNNSNIHIVKNIFTKKRIQ
ncbi:MAG: site-specific DNA-methyltransferase [Helicobacter sp.]|nr:site-specific DNA-methyltransferase [Helicobacter sp.]